MVYDYTTNSDVLASLPLLAAGFVGLIALTFGVVLAIRLAPIAMQLVFKAINHWLGG